MELLLKIKLMLMSLGMVTEVTRKTPYYYKLKKYKIRLFESNRMLYVVWENRIILKSVVQYFKLIYSENRNAFIFGIWKNLKEENQFYELNENGINYLETISGFSEFLVIKDESLILVRDGLSHSLVYNYDNQRILIEEERPVYWLEKSRLFVKQEYGSYVLLFPELREGIKFWGEKTNYMFSYCPKDTLNPQLVGQKVLKLSVGEASILDIFEDVEDASWLPKPYTHLATKGERLYMIGILEDDYEILEIMGNKVKPLELNIPDMKNYLVAQRDNKITILKYDRKAGNTVELAAFTGIDIILAKPELDIKEWCIKIPLKVLEERFLKK